jgi:subfamily B ATP-binding cassette protein MsbA
MSSNKFLLNLAKEKPWLVLSTFILSIVSAFLNGAGTALLVPILVVFLGESNEIKLPSKPAILKQVIGLFDYFEGQQKLLVMIVVVLATIILKNITIYISTMVSNHYTKYMTNRLRLEGVSLLLEVGIDFYAKNKIGDIFNRINREVERTTAAIKSGQKIIISSLTILIFVYFLLLISWQLTIIATVLLGIVAWGNQYFVNRSLQLGKILSEKSREYSRKMMELLTGIRLIKTVSNETEEFEIIEKFIKEREQAQLESLSISALLGPLNEISGIILILSLIFIGRYLFTQQLEQFGTILLTYLVVLFRLLPVVGQLNNARTQFANSIPSVEIVADFLKREDKPFLLSGNFAYSPLEKGIQFEQVSFAYPGYEKVVLKEIDLWIPKGKTIALVGASGAGKSTIADLLPRFYDPTQGRITIDGIDLRDYNLTSLRRGMGVASQDTFLFNNSVAYNLAYGLGDVSETEIFAAAKRANAYEFISQLPQGFETEIGDRGVILSGGQRQRIAIARALLRNPDILILDEATSALDTVSERLVQEAIDELCRDRTTLVIAHRLSTIQKAYQIVVLDRGKIVEIGNHEELLNQNGYYANLYAMQFRNHKETSISSNLEKAQEVSDRDETYLSYEMRNALNSMLGSLHLITEGLIDNPLEKEQLIEESYQSGKNLLDVLKIYEKNYFRNR